MSLFDMLQGPETRPREGIMGVAVAVVTNNQDPDGEGRIKVKYPWRNTEDESFWVRGMTFMGGKQMGGYFLPEVNDEVLVAFENGDIDHPFVLGSVWSTKMKPPEANSDGKNNIRMIKSRSGHKIILDDKDGNEKIEIKDKSEKNVITIDTKSNTITITSAKDIKLEAKQGKISLEAMQIETKSQAATKIEAGATMEVKASANMTIKGAMVMIN